MKRRNFLSIPIQAAAAATAATIPTGPVDLGGAIAFGGPGPWEAVELSCAPATYFGIDIGKDGVVDTTSVTVFEWTPDDRGGGSWMVNESVVYPGERSGS